MYFCPFVILIKLYIKKNIIGTTAVSTETVFIVSEKKIGTNPEINAETRDAALSFVICLLMK